MLSFIRVAGKGLFGIRGGKFTLPDGKNLHEQDLR